MRNLERAPTAGVHFKRDVIDSVIKLKLTAYDVLTLTRDPSRDAWRCGAPGPERGSARG